MGERTHIRECTEAMAEWRSAWNVSPVPYPVLKAKWQRVAKRCGCDFGGWD